MCVVNALLRAAEANCRSVAFPLLATGHARLRFDQSLRVIVQELREATLDHAWIVINDPDQLEETTRAVGEVFPGEVEVEMSAPQDERSSVRGGVSTERGLSAQLPDQQRTAADWHQIATDTPVCASDETARPCGHASV